MRFPFSLESVRNYGGYDLLMPLVVVGTLAVMLMPLPPLVIDTLLALNITVSLLMVLTAVQVGKPLEFSVFPSLLLITTLFRLSLNVSTTRLILLHGASGVDAAGQVVKTFGLFIVGGSYLVGIVVFLILTLINFTVITKGASRIAEVSARFTLDALPGKQMSIDSDLAAGLVTQDEARARREELSQETDFYGAMDGSSKFVRGDAIAGLIITALNIVGGLIVGVAQNGMPLGLAAETYTVLTVGDALVTQIPSLLISTASGIVITRVSDAMDLGEQVSKQILGNRRVLQVGGGIVMALALIPNMPITPFVLMGGALIALSRFDLFSSIGEGEESSAGADAADGPAAGELDLTELLPVQVLQFEVGYTLVPLVDAKNDGEVLRRITGLRKTIAQELGIVLPPVHVVDNLELKPGEYRLMVHGVEMARGDLMVDRLLAMDPGETSGKIDGIKTTEPAFGLPALWVKKSDRTEAEIAGYTVVEPATVVVTHLNEVLRGQAAKLVGRLELQQLLDVVATRNAKVVDELIPNVLTHAEVLAVIRGLLREQVSVRDMRTVLEALSDASRFGKSTPHLVDHVRQRLGPAIVQGLMSGETTLHAAILDASSEEWLRSSLSRTEHDTTLALDLPTAQSLISQVQMGAESLQARGWQPIVVAPPDLRYALWQFASRFVNPIHVLAHRELPPRVPVSTDITISLAAARNGLGAAPPAVDVSATANAEAVLA